MAPSLTAAALLLGLFVVHHLSGAAQPPRLAYRGDAPVRDLTAPTSEDLEDVFYTDLIEVARPSRLTLELSRGGAPGWIGVEYALVDLATGQAREGGIEATAPEGEGARMSEIVLDRVEPGRYVMRLLVAWDPRGTLALVDAPRSIGVRVFVGGRASYELWGVGAALLLPLAMRLLRSRWSPRASATLHARAPRARRREIGRWYGVSSRV